MKYTRLKSSWEKQDWYLLENGWEACVEHNPHYGPYLKLLRGPDVGGIGGSPIWSASNGRPPELGAAHYNTLLKVNKYVDLPDFAQAWVEPQRCFLVRPGFLDQSIK